MLKPRTIALSIFAIWGVIACLYFIRDISSAANAVTTVKVVDTPKNEQKAPVEAKTPSIEEVDIAKEEPEFNGEILLNGNLCLDTLEHKSGNVGLWECHGEGRNQYWHITKDHLLRNDDVCIQAPPENENSNLAKLEKCDGNVKEQKWIYKDSLLVLSDTSRCIDGADRQGIKVIPCNKDSASQKAKLSSASKELGA